MTVYEFYEKELRAFKDAKTNKKEKIKTLFQNSVEAMYDWGMKITSNMPDDAYTFMRGIINSKFSEECDDSNLSIYIESDLIRCATGSDDFSFKPEKPFNSPDYLEFKKIMNCELSIIIFPNSPDFIHVRIIDNADCRKLDRQEKTTLNEILHKIYPEDRIYTSKFDTQWLAIVSTE